MRIDRRIFPIIFILLIVGYGAVSVFAPDPPLEFDRKTQNELFLNARKLMDEQGCVGDVPNIGPYCDKKSPAIIVNCQGKQTWVVKIEGSVKRFPKRDEFCSYFEF